MWCVMISEALLRKLFLAAIAFLATLAIFAFGLAAGRFQVWPYEVVLSMWDSSQSLIRFGRVVPKQQLVEAPADASRQRFTIYSPELTNEGFYTFLGWDDQSQRYSAWLYDSNGKHLHTWVVNYYELDPEGPSTSDSPHAMAVLRDGSIIVNYDDADIMPRLGTCSKPIWINHGVYHHSLHEADDGTFWTWLAERSAYGQYQYLINFDPETGKEITRIGLVDDMIKNADPSAIVFGLRPDYPFVKSGPAAMGKRDIFHPNDIEPLSSDLVDKFPAFDAGDLLLSFRTSDLVAVVDPDDKEVKWWGFGPWQQQHDPDFTEDGKISVYSNNSDVGRSEIIKVHPTTREISNDLFHGEFHFYSETMGKHQYLPNGNVLVVVPHEGRVVEVSSQGDKVLAFNNLSRVEDFNAHVSDGVWLPADYFEEFPECSASSS